MTSVPPPSTLDGGVAIRNVSMSFPGTMALDRLDLDLRPGQIHALLGANGSGKSTLVKILSGFQAPDAGSTVTVSDRPLALDSPKASLEAGCRFVHQDLALIDSMTVADNVMLTGGWPTRLRAVRRLQAEEEVRLALAELGADISPRALMATLSPAMRTIVAVVRALRRDASDEVPITALVLDEPTATLPQHEVEVLARVIRQVAHRGTAVMIISHHLQEALDLADVVTVLRDGRRVLSAPAAELDRRMVISAMLGQDYRAAETGRSAPTSDRTVLECLAVSGPSLIDVAFSVREGEIVGVAGLEGSGRDELLPAIFGSESHSDRCIVVDGTRVESPGVARSIRAGVAYLPADRARSAAIPELSARENLTISDLTSFSRAGRINRSSERRESADWLERVQVRPGGAGEQRLAAFSGGNQQKVMLARCMRLRPRVLLLDEPTQGIDVAAQATLHGLLLDYVAGGAGAVVSSSDEEELAAICHRVLIMRRGRIAHELVGAAVTPSAIADLAADADSKEIS